MAQEPTPDEAAEALAAVRRQRLRLATGPAAPRWLSILLLGTAAAAAVTGSLADDLLDGPARQILRLTSLGVLCLVFAALVMVCRGIGVRALGFGAVAVPPAHRQWRNFLRVLAVLGPAVVLGPALAEVFEIPLPRTSVTVFWILYTPVAFVILRSRTRRDLRTLQP